MREHRPNPSAIGGNGFQRGSAPRLLNGSWMATWLLLPLLLGFGHGAQGTTSAAYLRTTDSIKVATAATGTAWIQIFCSTRALFPCPPDFATCRPWRKS